MAGLPLLPSSNAQQLREALGIRLRELRAHARLKGVQLAALMECHSSKITRIEHGAQTPTVDDIEAWVVHCGATELREDLLASLRSVESVLVQYERLERDGFALTQAKNLPIYERTSGFRAYSSWLFPGIVQTEAYTRAVWRLLMSRRGVPDDIDLAMPDRLARQQYLRDRRKRFAFIIEESALRVGFGGAEVMMAQLSQLIHVSTMANVSLGVLPMVPDREAEPVEDFWIFDEARVEVELVSSQLCLTTRRDVGMYVSAFTQFAKVAVHGREARALITGALDDLDANSRNSVDG